jgi:hypothetical protein
VRIYPLVYALKKGGAGKKSEGIRSLPSSNTLVRWCVGSQARYNIFLPCENPLDRQPVPAYRPTPRFAKRNVASVADSGLSCRREKKWGIPRVPCPVLSTAANPHQTRLGRSWRSMRQNGGHSATSATTTTPLIPGHFVSCEIGGADAGGPPIRSRHDGAIGWRRTRWNTMVKSCNRGAGARESLIQFVFRANSLGESATVTACSLRRV